MSFRIQQINSLLQTEVADALRTHVDLRDFGMISVLAVDTAMNLRSVKVYVNAILNNDRLLPYLEKHHNVIQRAVMKRVRMKPVPLILFRLDPAVARAARIDELIAEEERRMRERDALKNPKKSRKSA